MTATKSIPEFEVLGRQMAEFGVGPNDLEARINAVGEEELTDEQKRSIVTGFVDAFLGSKESQYRLQAAYSLVHGFARFTYNGDFKTMRDKVLHKFAASSLDDSTIRWLKNDKKDAKAIERIAEFAADNNPELIYAIMPHGDKRKAFMQKIVDKFRDNKNHAEVVRNAMYELDDREGLRAIGRELMIQDWGPNNRLLGKFGTREDYVFVAGELLKKKDIKHAYEAIIFALPRGCKPAPTIEEARLLSTIKREFIKNHPHEAMYSFKQAPEERFGSKETYKDLEGLLQVGHEFAERGEWDSALRAYQEANCETNSPEVRLVALKLLHNINKYKSEHINDFAREAIWKVAVEYFNTGGDPDIADNYIDAKSAGDNVNRALGVALARKREKSTHSYRYIVESAYSRIMAVKQKTAADEKLLSTLRTRILDSGEYANTEFIQHNDEQGMRAYIARFKNEYVRRAYDTSVALKDDAILEEMRQLVLGTGLRNAQHVFEQAKDEKGLAHVRNRIAPGVNKDIVAQMIHLEKKE